MRRFTKYCLLGGLLVTTPLALSPALSYAEKTDTYQLLNLFGDIFERVRSDYVEEVKDSDLVEAAINGMLTSLDPHSAYMNEKAFKEMQVQTKGEFGGLGIEVTMENGLVKVVSPIDDTPAFKAGLKPGDYISHIDDEQVMGLSLSEAVEKMRGPVDSKVKLTVLRENTNEPIEVTLTRAIIKIKSARAHAEGDDIVYLRITSFTEQTTDLMRDEFERARKGMDRLRGVVLDLRNNPGGLLDQAVSVSDAFIKQGEIVSTRERDAEKTKRYAAHAGDELIDDSVPMVVLVNSGSASASEIVSGALQDHKRAIILGVKTFGKGSVQTVIPIPEHGAIRLTTARYYTPSGRSIQAKGIEPDINVEQAKIEPIKGDTHQRSEADLRKRLENLEDKKSREEEAKREEGKLEGDAEKSDKDKKKKGKTNPDSAEDFQLQRALDVLRALGVYSQVLPEK